MGTHCGEGYQVAISAVCQDDRTWRVQGQCVQSEFGNGNGNGKVCFNIESERVSVYINTSSRLIDREHVISYCLWKNVRIIGTI